MYHKVQSEGLLQYSLLHLLLSYFCGYLLSYISYAHAEWFLHVGDVQLWYLVRCVL